MNVMLNIVSLIVVTVNLIRPIMVVNDKNIQ